MAHETTTALICDRCGHLERFGPGHVPAQTGAGVPPGTWGWVQSPVFAAPRDLCAGCKVDLKLFMSNSTVRPGSTRATETPND